MKFCSQVLLAPLLAAVLSSCGTVKHRIYDYETVRIDTDSGVISMSFSTSSDPIEVFEDGKRFIVWTNPYLFNVQYLSSNREFLRGEICDLEIRSASTGRIFYNSDCLQDIHQKLITPFSEKMKMYTGFGVPDLEIHYESYNVTFRYIIYGENDSIFDTGVVDDVIETYYFEERHIG